MTLFHFLCCVCWRVSQIIFFGFHVQKPGDPIGQSEACLGHVFQSLEVLSTISVFNLGMVISDVVIGSGISQPFSANLFKTYGIWQHGRLWRATLHHKGPWGTTMKHLGPSLGFWSRNGQSLCTVRKADWDGCSNEPKETKGSRWKPNTKDRSGVNCEGWEQKRLALALFALVGSVYGMILYKSSSPRVQRNRFHI